MPGLRKRTGWKVALGVGLAALLLAGGVVALLATAGGDYAACIEVALEGPRPVAQERDRRFLGKVAPPTARCRGGGRAVANRGRPWVDWPYYWAAGGPESLSQDFLSGLGWARALSRDGFGIRGALLDLEYQRVELLKLNLFDNDTYPAYVTGRDGTPGRALRRWPEMRLPPGHPAYAAVGGDGEQVCRGGLIRFRTLTGICNDVFNPAMGSTGMRFARNVPFEETFPRLGLAPLARNRHGGRISLLRPDPQVISRMLFTRGQREPERCNAGLGLPGGSPAAECDYRRAPFLNVLAAFWIQFMTHDWFSHLDEARNDTARSVAMGCRSQRVGGEERPLSEADARRLGCRPGDRMEAALIADGLPAPQFEHDGERRLARAYKTTRNTVTAWWDASQLYGYDERSVRRVRRDPHDPARLLLVPVPGREDAGDAAGYLPVFGACPPADEGCRDMPVNPEWAGQEAVAFPDNWTVGLSFLHNLFAREHNTFVARFRAYAAAHPGADSGLRRPARPETVVPYGGVSDEELFQIARLVVAAEIAKIHTIEWTTQLLYNEPLYRAMNANWGGLFSEHPLLEAALQRVVRRLRDSEDPKRSGGWYSVLSAGPGIVGTGSRKPGWRMDAPEDIGGGVNHFGSPFNFPEEFVTVYRLHAMVPDLLEYRELRPDANVIRRKVPVVRTFRGRATRAMRAGGMANWAFTLGRQRAGALTLLNHPRFLQNLAMPLRLDTPTRTVDVAALDILRDRERGVPRFNEFRRQYGLASLRSFDDLIDRTAPPGAQARQERIVRLLREVYGTHRCDASLVITAAQRNPDGSALTDCLGHAPGSVVDNVEDLDTVVGWLAEPARPHGSAISETQLQVFILNASRRLFSDRFFTSSFRPEFYTGFGLAWVRDNGPDGKRWELGRPNGHRQEVSPMKRVLLRNVPSLAPELAGVVNAFDPWARARDGYYALDWTPRPGAADDPAFAAGAQGKR